MYRSKNLASAPFVLVFAAVCGGGGFGGVESVATVLPAPVPSAIPPEVPPIAPPAAPPVPPEFALRLDNPDAAGREFAPDLVMADFDGDGIVDLAVGAPGNAVRVPDAADPLAPPVPLDAAGVVYVYRGLSLESKAGSIVALRMGR